MRAARVWLSVCFVVAALGGGAMLLGPATPPSSAQPRDLDRAHWRYHDGHWSYWHEGDKRWYYTDGRHWYYHDNNAWRPYRFDRGFGRDGFERGEYKFPEGTKVIVPEHRVYESR